MKIVVQIASLIFLYIVASYAAWSVSVPPFYVSFFWPAAGIALGYVYLYGSRVLLGVFIGAFASVFLSPINHDYDVIGVLFAMGIATGATIQAYIGRFFIVKAIGEHSDFNSMRSILLFSSIAVFSALIASLIALSLFLSAGRLELSSALSFWEPWFIGDALGVLIFAPLTVFLLSRSAISLQRRLIVVVPIVVLLCIIIFAFFNFKMKDTEVRRDLFDRNIQIIQGELKQQFEIYISYISSLQGFYHASEYVDLEEFDRFVAPILDEDPGVYALAWVPYVKDAHKEDFLSVGRELYGQNFDIKLVGKPSGYKHEGAEFYLPVLYIRPEERTNDMVGSDLWSNEARRKAINESKNQGEITASEPITLIGDSVSDYGFLLSAPVFDEDEIKGPYDIDGVIVGGFKYNTAVKDLMLAWQSRGIELMLQVYLNGEMQVVFQTQDVDSAENIEKYLTIDVPYNFAGQDWVFSFYMPMDFYNQNVNLSIWYALVCALVFLSFIFIFLSSISGQAAFMQTLVDAKTAELSHKNKFLNIVMDTVPDMIFVKDSNFNIVQANQSFKERFAPEVRDHLIGTTGLEKSPKEEREIYLYNDRKAFETGFSETQETNTDYKGETITLQTRKQRFVDENNKPFLLGYARDITELLSAQSQLEIILDTAADGLITMQEFGVIETYNKACEAIFGYLSEEVIGKNIDLLIPDYNPIDHINIDMDGKSGTLGRLEFQARRKDGKDFPIDLSIAEVVIGGRHIYSVVIRDISGRKKAEEIGRQITQIFNSSFIEFYIFDAETMEFVFVNKGAIQNMGYSEEELLGRKPSEFVKEYSDQRFFSMAEQLLSGSKERFDFDMRHTRKDSSFYDVAVNLQLTVFNGRPAFIASMLDITARNKVTNELKRSNKELESFAYVTSHDLKAPLRHVSMSASFFKDEYSEHLDEKAKKLLNVMIDGTDRMQSMIESLLTYSRVGKQGANLTNVNLNEVLLAVRQNLHEDLTKETGKLSFDMMPNVRADRYLMIQLFQNLVQNAIKYRKENEAPLIHVSYEDERDMIKLSVADNGIGVDPEYSDKIFQIFQRLHRDNEYEGVGIGLSICQRIIEFHGGVISLDKTYDSGTKIDFTLPKA